MREKKGKSEKGRGASAVRSGVAAWSLLRRATWLLFLVFVAPPAGAQQTDTTQQNAPQPVRPAPLDTVRAEAGREAPSGEVRRVEIIGADELTGTVEDGASVRRLVGNVRLRQEQTRLRARRATQYADRNEILFVGDVLIVEEGDSLRADRVLYDTRQKIGRARGRMRLSDGEVVITGPSGRYFADEKRATFEEGVTLVDSASVLTSQIGEYFTDEKRAEFAGDVRLVQRRSVLEADSVTYYRDRDVSRARGSVVIERFGDENDEAAPPPDTARSLMLPPDMLAADTLAARHRPPLVTPADTLRRTLLFGERAFNDEQAGLSRVEGRALLVRLEADSAGAPVDTLLLRARSLESTRADSLERLVATGDVEIWQRDLAAVADSAVYDQRRPPRGPEREETRLFQSPMAWTPDQGQLSGDTLRITGGARQVDSLFAFPNAFAAQKDTLLGRIQQLRGRRLVGFFARDTLRRITVGPNAEAIRFLANSEQEPNGAVEVSSDFMYFFFEEGQLKRMNGTSGVEGVQYPEDSVPSPFQLDGYVWVPEEKPTRAALLDARARSWLERGARLRKSLPEKETPGKEAPGERDAAPPVAAGAARRLVQDAVPDDSATTDDSVITQEEP